MLLLEFNLVCCLSYNQVGDVWEEVITPFYEWKQYLQFLNETMPPQITDIKAIQRRHPSDFGFIEEMSEALKGKPSLSPEVANRVIEMNLATFEKNTLKPTPKAAEWLEMPPQEKGMSVYRLLGNPSNRQRHAHF